MGRARCRRLTAVLVLVTALCACGSASSSSGTTVTLTWQSKGHTVNVARGTKIVVKLKSLYWHNFRSSNRAVVRRSGTASRKAGHCPPGFGCGTVTVPFKAFTSGIARIRANRSNCGEAFKCSPSQSRYDVTIRVS